MLAWSTILVVCHATLAASPRAVVVSLDAADLAPAQRASTEAALAVHGFDAVDPVDRAHLQAAVAQHDDPQALAIEAKKAFLAFASDQARERLARAQAVLHESPRFLSERTLLADLHLLEAQIALSEGRGDDATQALARAILLESERELHPGVYPPDLLEAYARARAWLAEQPRGAVVVATWPEGAHVYVDGVFSGEAPVVVDELSAGWHYATAIVDGRGARTRPLRVEGGRSTQVTLFVPDATLHAQMPAILQRYRERPADPDLTRALLQAVGAELLIGCGDEIDAAARVLGPDSVIVVVQPRREPALELEARIEHLLQALAQQAASQPAARRPADTGAAAKEATGDEGSTASPWLWAGAGAGALLLASGIAAIVVVALNWPQPEPPADLVDIYLGGPSP